jgi:hypothetical protein
MKSKKAKAVETMYIKRKKVLHRVCKENGLSIAECRLNADTLNRLFEIGADIAHEQGLNFTLLGSSAERILFPSLAIEHIVSQTQSTAPDYSKVAKALGIASELAKEKNIHIDPRRRSIPVAV